MQHHAPLTPALQHDLAAQVRALVAGDWRPTGTNAVTADVPGGTIEVWPSVTVADRWSAEVLAGGASVWARYAMTAAELAAAVAGAASV